MAAEQEQTIFPGLVTYLHCAEYNGLKNNVRLPFKTLSAESIVGKAAASVTTTPLALNVVRNAFV